MGEVGTGILVFKFFNLIKFVDYNLCQNAGSIVITGAGGYLGYHIALEAARRGKFSSVVALDVKEPLLEWGKRFRSNAVDGEDREAVVRNIHFFKGSVSSKEDLK